MTSSTVSITANPSGASLRRPIHTGDKNSGDGIIPANGGKDLSDNSIRAGTETVLEKSKETVQTKNPNSTNTKLRKRTVVKKSNTKPAWKTAVSVILKNLGLLVILLLLAQMIRKLGFGSGYSGNVLVGDVGLDYERRIAEVEKFLKTTTKMMQVQVEVVDRKIDNEIAGLKTEVSKRIDDDRVEFGKKVGMLDGRVEEMEKVFGSGKWLSRDEFDKFVEDFKGGSDVGQTRLDEIRAFAKEIVEREIEKHAADGLGKVDYAVATGGASVLKHSEAFVSSSRVGSWFTGNVRSDAVKMLQPSFGQPGECFPLKGDNGFVEIKLRTAIVPEAITLEHVSKSVAFDRSSAPKECKVLGWLRSEEDTQEEHLLTEFTYDLEKSSAQTFNVLEAGGSNAAIIDSIRLEFLSNHGSPTHTCIYRVRVHGHEPVAL
uniref:SUN domain-containing protein 1-like n=1 Tax=Erigeron canadensis TaxID=72917 RepID=UPI001CB9BDF0|nr:SUN domain-containing protein 1-like [Erigeron canadensis]